MQAVIGTFAAFAGTLAAYKFFDIKVGQKFRTFVVAAMFGMVGLGLLEVVLSVFGNEHRLLRLRRRRPAVRDRRPGARRLHADPRLRLRRAGRSPPASPSASRGARRSPSPSAWSGSTPTCCGSWRSSARTDATSTPAARPARPGGPLSCAGRRRRSGRASSPAASGCGSVAFGRLGVGLGVAAPVPQLDPAAADAAPRAADLGAVELGAGRPHRLAPPPPRPAACPRRAAASGQLLGVRAEAERGEARTAAARRPGRGSRRPRGGTGRGRTAARARRRTRGRGCRRATPCARPARRRRSSAPRRAGATTPGPPA